MGMRARAQRELLNRHRDADMPHTARYSPTFYDDSVRATLMIEAVRDAGLEDGDEITQHYWEDEQVLIIDLGGDDGE
jgi:hypothetical protein